jgi:hypothetical protein
MADVIVAEGQWRDLLRLDPKPQATRVRIGCLNAVPTGAGGLHRWLHRGDVLAVLYREAERLDSFELRRLADRIKESTHKEGRS